MSAEFDIVLVILSAYYQKPNYDASPAYTKS